MSAGWVLYDGDCSFCRELASRSEKVLRQRGFDFATLQTPWVQSRLGLKPDVPPEEMKVLTAEGEVIGGAAAVVYLAKRVWWAWPFYLIAQLPFVDGALRAAYRRVAERRTCIGGACVRPGASRWPDWLPLIVLTLSALTLRQKLPSWAFMWALAFSMYAGCKWLSWRRALKAGKSARLWRSVGYLLAWPGMDAQSFLDTERRPPRPANGEWGKAILKTVLGAALLWWVARLVPGDRPLLAGWVGLLGLILILHFGTFHIAALLWQRFGVDARPIMRAPVLSASLRDFWGARWNLGFHQLAQAFVFRPLLRTLGRNGAILATFLASGLVHDLVISLPAGAGYGLPTAYFVLQGFGILIEHSRPCERLGLYHALPGRLFTLLFTAGPVFWLFHPQFVIRVVVPFMEAIGGL